MELTEQLERVLDAYAKLVYEVKMEDEYNNGASSDEKWGWANSQLCGFRLALTLVLNKDQLDVIQSCADAIAQQLHDDEIAIMLEQDEAAYDLQVEEEIIWSEWYAHQNKADERNQLPNNGWPDEFNCFDDWHLCMQAIDEQWLYWAEMPGDHNR